MAIPTIVWTALPNGFDDAGTPRLSLYASFRLEDPSATTLGDYTTPDAPGLGNWPQAVQYMATSSILSFVFSTSPTLPLPAVIDTAQLRPDVWPLLFPAGTLVRPHEFQDHAKRKIRSFSTSQVNAFIEKVYTRVANASPRDFPDVLGKSDLNDLATSWGTAVGRLRRMTAPSNALFAVPGNLLYPPPTSSGRSGTHPDIAIESELDALQSALGTNVPLAELFRTYRFYNRGQLEPYRPQHEPIVEADIPAPPKEPKFDFHEVVAMLGDHPLLLRMLGLVIDCTVPRAAAFISSQQPSEGEVRATFGWPGTNPAASPFLDQRPWTSYAVGAAGFLARPKDTSDLNGGMLQIGNAKRFDVFQNDVDGTALKVLDFATNLASVVAQATDPSCPSPEGTPPKAPYGLPALRNAGITVARRNRDEVLYQQLIDAQANNTDPGSALLYADDVTRGYRVDVLFRGSWQSLCRRQMTYVVSSATGSDSIPLSGLPADEGYVKAASGSSTLKDPPGSPGGAQDLYVHEGLFGWDNWSLVVPRPGRTVTHDRFEADATKAFGHREIQPNPDYPIEYDAKVVGYSLPALRFGEPYQLRARAVDLAGNGHAYNVDATTLSGAWISPVVTYQRHEPVANPVLLLRAPLTPGESLERMVVRSKVGSTTIVDEDTVFNAENERHVAPPKTSQMMAELHGAFDPYFKDPAAAFDIARREKGSFSDPGPGVELIDASGASVDTAPLDDSGEPLPNGQYIIHTKSQVTLPYLPDPLAVGAAFDGLDADQIVEQSYDGSDSWPDRVPFRLVLAASSSNAAKYTRGTPFTVALPKATILTIRYSSATTLEGRKLMARYNSMSPAGQSQTEARSGQHWMLSPYRELTFVHAVEKPMKKPALDSDLVVDRGVGDTFASLRGHLLTHSRSTGKAEVRATWSEMVDRLHDDGPRMEDRGGRVFDRTILYGEDSTQFPDHGACAEPARHEFGDTKHRWVDYFVIGTTRYREYFPPEITANLDLITSRGPSTDRINIPSSARPDPPHVLYILPTFRWEQDGKKSIRHGRGLRIYLDRPWYSSGDDELLGVVLRPAGILLATQAQELDPYVSEWGADPVWDDAGPTEGLAPRHFVSDPNDPDSEPTVGTGLSLAELAPENPLTVTAVGFKPHYSSHRYYVDVELDPGNRSCTFVRLALARYQPYSVPTAHLSRIVRTEFAQLLADRTATLSFDGETAVEITVSGVMPKNEIGHTLPPSTYIQFEAPEQAVTPIENRSASVFNGPAELAQTPELSTPSLFKKNPAAGLGRIVHAQVERLENPAAPDLGWGPVDGGVRLASYTSPISPDDVFWRGRVALPQSFRDGSSKHRLVVRELELFETDDDVAETDLYLVNAARRPLRSRLVYADILPLAT